MAGALEASLLANLVWYSFCIPEWVPFCTLTSLETTMATLAMPDQVSGHSHIEAPAAEFQERFNQKSFELTHHLANHPLFKLERLMQLTKSIRETHPKDAYYDAGDIGISTRWDQAPKGVFSIDEAIERIGSAGAWVLLKKAQYDPDYKVLLDETMAELKAFVGKDLTPYIKRDEMIIFITSPKRISSYHIDRECNFLLQIHGEKTIHVFDQKDREVLPETEIETFWASDNNAPVYKPQYQDRANTYLLRPGTGVHIPVNAPHWLQNGDDISISLSVSFQFKDSVLANVYRANFFLRKLGMHPSPPGSGVIRDSLKRVTIGSAMYIRRLFRGESPW